MTPEDVQSYFRKSDGQYLFARWGRPIVPVVFGVEEKTLEIIKGAVEAVVTLANHKMAETDPELGANLMIFFLRDWKELLDIPNLEEMVPGLDALVARLDDMRANHYRTFRFDDQAAIRACFAFVRMDAELSELPAETIALNEAVQMIVLWSDCAFKERSPLATVTGSAVLRPDLADLIRAAYDPMMPCAAHDDAHAYRLSARTELSR